MTLDNLRLITTILLAITCLASLAYNLQVDRRIKNRIKKIQNERLVLPDLMKVQFQKMQDQMLFDAVADVEVGAVARRGDVILLRSDSNPPLEQQIKIKESLENLTASAGISFVYLGTDLIVEAIVRSSGGPKNPNDSANNGDQHSDAH